MGLARYDQEAEAWRWKQHAACRGMDPDLFYPERGGDSIEHHREAVAVCNRCPVRQECAAYGMRERWGIWGGMSYHARRDLRANNGRLHLV